MYDDTSTALSLATKAERRRGIALRMIGLSELQRLILSTMADDQRAWRILTLSDEILFARSAIRNELRALELVGWASFDPDQGWSLTEAGLVVANSMHTEVADIASGSKRRFSGELCAAIEASGLRPQKHPTLAEAVI